VLVSPGLSVEVHPQLLEVCGGRTLPCFRDQARFQKLPQGKDLADILKAKRTNEISPPRKHLHPALLNKPTKRFSYWRL
jgi:hypothetical protein